jgi:hypothetical protein
VPIAKANNPAARLLNLIEKLSVGSPEQPSQTIWGAALTVRADDVLELLDRIGRIMNLPKVTRDALSAVRPKLDPIYFEWVPQVEAAFKAHRLTGVIREFLTPITADTRRTLRFCADRLSDLSPEKVLENDDLTKLRREAAELRSELENAEIDSDLKKFAWRHLKEFIAALDEYEFFGVSPLNRATEEAMGSVRLNLQVAEKLSVTEIGKRLFTFFGKTLMLLSALHGAAQLPGDIPHFLIDAPPIVQAPASAIKDRTGSEPVSTESVVQIAGRDDDKNGAS